MKVKINREQLLKEVEAVLPGLSKKELIEQSDCVVFKDGRIFTYNDEVACSVATNAALKGAIAAEPLAELLRKRKDDDLEMETSKKDLTVKGKRFKASIRMQKKILLPIKAIKEPKTWKKLHTKFGEALKYVMGCAGKDESQFALTCVHINPKFVEACDNQQIGRFKMKTGFKKAILVRKNALRYIVSLDMTEFGETKNWVHFRNPAGLVLSCRRYLDEYPDMSAILKVSGDDAVLPKGLREAVACAEIFSTENVTDNLITVSLSKNKLKITGEGASGSYTEHKKITYSGADMSFKIPPALLVDLVNRSNRCEVTQSRLKIELDKFVYVTALRLPDEKNP